MAEKESVVEEKIAKRPQPYRIDDPIQRVQTVDVDGDTKYVFRHDFTRLDATNVGLLLQREKNTERVTEKMTKGRTRFRLHSLEADRTFYSELIQGGGWRPHGLSAVQDEQLIPPSSYGLYAHNESKNVWEPGWNELSKEQMLQITPERMAEAINRWLSVKGKSVATGGIDFMFEKGGLMRIALLIGDADEPAYKLLFEIRRPDSKRRTRFKDDFAYAIDHSKGELGKVETIIDLRQGIDFFDEYFATCPDDSEYSQIIFEDKASSNGSGPAVVPYSDGLRNDLLMFLNPYFKVDIAAAAIQSFSKTDQEL